MPSAAKQGGPPWWSGTGGEHPRKSFPVRSTSTRLSRSPSREGIGPVRRLSLRSSDLRLESLARSTEICPVSRLSLRSTACRFASLPSSAGIGPVNRFSNRCSRRRPARSPSSTGIVPSNPRLLTDRPTTRGSVPPTVTPSQSLIGVLADQLSRPLPARASRAARSDSQSDMMPASITAETAPAVTHTLGVVGVPVADADHTAGSPARSTARTCTSYCVPGLRPVMVYCRLPPAESVQTLSSTVQLASTVSSSAVGM